MPPSWFIPASNDTRVRVLAFSKTIASVRSRKRLVELVALEPVLDPARAREQVVEFLPREVAKLEEMLGWRGGHGSGSPASGVKSGAESCRINILACRPRPAAGLTGVKARRAGPASLRHRAAFTSTAPMTDIAELPATASREWEHDFAPLVIRGRRALPIVQGGMGVGISAHRLAGTVAGLGAVGTIASIDLRRHHPDLMAQSANTDKATVTVANMTALDREIRAAKELAGGRGIVAVNIMRAVSDYASSVRQACASGADAIVMGAGLPLDLPGPGRRFSGRRAHSAPVRRARHPARHQEMGAQGARSGCHRDRASALRRRPPRRGEDRRPRRSAVRFRAGAAGRACVSSAPRASRPTRFR